MAKLTTRMRKKIPQSDFALPAKKGPRGGQRSRFPINDRAHAANAKARAIQGVKRGTLSRAEADKVIRKANKLLYGVATTDPNIRQKAIKKRRMAK